LLGSRNDKPQNTEHSNQHLSKLRRGETNHGTRQCNLAEILAEEGYQIRGLAQAIQLSDDETYILTNIHG
jgi:hypothetical protein